MRHDAERFTWCYYNTSICSESCTHNSGHVIWKLTSSTGHAVVLLAEALCNQLEGREFDT
jgi:hypothetical protein